MVTMTMVEYHKWLCANYGFGVGHGVMYGGGEWEMPCSSDDDLAFLLTTLPAAGVKVSE